MPKTIQELTTEEDKVMTPAHPRWAEFTKRLEGPEGCNFKEGKKVTWDCAGGTDKSHATKILKAMGMDVKSSLAFFEAAGGYCDCEILFNVEESAKA